MVAILGGQGGDSAATCKTGQHPQKFLDPIAVARIVSEIAVTSKGRTPDGAAGRLRASRAFFMRGASMYLVHISLIGPIRYGQLPGSIDVHDSLDNPMPIGMASCRGWGLDGLAVWTLRIGGQEIPGRWVIIAKRFVPAQ